MSWNVEPALDNERLDQALTALDPSLSRAQWQKHIKEGCVTVDGKAVLIPHRRVQVGQVLAFTPGSGETIPLEASASPITPLRIIAETADWLVIDKSDGLLVHPAAEGSTEPTLIDALLAHDPRIAKVGPEPERPGIIHRLDRDVSGLMVVAKTQAAYDDLQSQFRERKIDKTYLALVHGNVEQDEGDIRFKLARSTTKGRMAARPVEDTEGKVAWTHYAVLERLPGATLLRVNIFSGRTHQIRAHLFALGHPVFGDPLYKRRSSDRRNEAPRLMLQSVELGFHDPASGERQVFKLDPDPAFAHLQAAWRTHETPKKDT